MKTAVLIALLALGQQSNDASKLTGQPCTGAELVGTWQIVESGGQSRAATEATSHKLVTPTHFVVLSVDAEDSVSYAHGGPYTISGGTYTESIKYGFGAPFEQIRGMKISFQCRIEAGRWHIVGQINGQTIDERWMREPADPK
jgi:hypothetical protein